MREIARPNNDTLYVSALLDLRKDAVILEMPAFDSDYVSLMVTGYDHYVNVPMATRLGDFRKPEKMLFYTERTEGYNGEPVEIAIDTHLAHVLRHPEYIRVQYMLWGSAIDPSSEFKPNVTEFMQIQRESVTGWIRDGQAAGEIRPELDPDRLAEQYYGALIGITKQWQVSPDFDLRAAYTDFKQQFVRQIRAT